MDYFQVVGVRRRIIKIRAHEAMMRNVRSTYVIELSFLDGISGRAMVDSKVFTWVLKTIFVTVVVLTMTTVLNLCSVRYVSVVSIDWTVVSPVP